MKTVGINWLFLVLLIAVAVIALYIALPEDPYKDLPLTGDLNGDGDVNAGDLTYLQNLIAGNPSYQNPQAHPDVNWDGQVNQEDVDYFACYRNGDPACPELYPGSG